MRTASTPDLFDDATAPPRAPLSLGPGAVVLPGAVGPRDAAVLAAVDAVLAQAPLRHLVTPGGWRMSVAMSNCGPLGWVSDRRGYRYDARDPQSGRPWPPLPTLLLQLAAEAAAQAGFDGFVPDACLINAYAPGARLTLHQDRDEGDTTAPIVSVSLGLPAVFLFGGLARGDPTARVPLQHGDIAVWGGPARLRFHGVLPVKDGWHPRVGARRLNLTFRKAR